MGNNKSYQGSGFRVQGSEISDRRSGFRIKNPAKKRLADYLPLRSAPCTLYPEKGFTLIELMIVVIIIAALSAMVVPRLSNRSEQAKIAVAEADINSNIGLALKLYKLDNGRYPTTEQGLKALLSKPSSSPAPRNWNGPYLENEPLDPWKLEYNYKCPGANNADGYDLYSWGIDGIENSPDDITNWK